MQVLDRLFVVDRPEWVNRRCCRGEIHFRQRASRDDGRRKTEQHSRTGHVNLHSLRRVVEDTTRGWKHQLVGVLYFDSSILIFKSSRVLLVGKVKGIFVATILTRKSLKYVTIFRVSALKLIRDGKTGEKRATRVKAKEILKVMP